MISHNIHPVYFIYLTWNSFAGTLSANRVKVEADLPFLKLSTILKATDNFSVSNKLGQGGFGPVYKVVYTPYLTNDGLGLLSTCMH